MNHLRRSYEKCIAHFPKTRLQHSSASAAKPTAAIVAEAEEKQACILTNTILQDGHPPMLQDNRSKREGYLSIADATHLVDNIKQSVLQTDLRNHDWATVSNPEKAYEIVAFKYKLSEHMLENLVKNLWKSTYARKSGLKDTTLSSRQDSVFQSNKRKIPKSRNGHLISGKKLLPCFADQDLVESTRSLEVSWENFVASNSVVDIMNEIPSKFQTNHDVTHDGSPFPCPHKLLSANNFRWPSRLNQGIFQNFTNALTYALNNGAEMGKDLKEPIPIQFAAFNGTSFYFMWYQLNTLNFRKDASSSGNAVNGLENDNSIKNLAWTSEARLCESITAEIPDTDYCITFSDNGIQRKRNEGQNGVRMNGFDEKAAQLFTEFMVSPISSVV